MVSRLGYGKGKGRGYLNLISLDPYIHSLSAKGVRTRQFNSYNLFAKSERCFLEYDKKGNPVNLPYNIDSMPNNKRRGLIKELAKKAIDGVSWAVKWEKEHLPKQKEWVKAQYVKAKDLAHRVKDNIKDTVEKKHEDLADVRDELDIDDNGTQDISIEQLDNVNDGIRTDLETIDTDGNNVPDYMETEPLDDLDIETQITEPKVAEKKKSFFSSGKEFAEKEFKVGKEFVKKKIAEREHTQEELRALSNKELKELSIKTTKTSLFGGKDMYEKELLRRVGKEKQIDFDVETAMRLPISSSGGTSSSSSVFSGMFTGLNPFSLTNQKAEPRKRAIQKSTSNSGLGLGDLFGFANPFYVLQNKNQKVNSR